MVRLLGTLGLQEIGGYAWHKVADLPATRDEGNQTFLSEDGVKHKFFMVRLGLLPLCVLALCMCATGVASVLVLLCQRAGLAVCDVNASLLTDVHGIATWLP
jgi:hypothetical protein